MTTVDVRGTIVSDDDKWIYDWFDVQSVCPNDIHTALNDANGDEITLRINSGGGDVFAGNEIGYAISEYSNKITADITGFCGSAATIIACSATKCRAFPSMMYMIHNVSSGAQGDYNDMDKQSEILKTANKSIANIYMQKTGLSEKELLDLMNKESWFDATTAKEKGFVDEIIGESGAKPFTINNAYGCQILSDEVKQKIKNLVKKEPANADKAFFIAQEQLNLLKMKAR